MRARAVLLFAVIVAIAADKPPKDGKKELDQFEGQWTMVSEVERGKKATDEAIKGCTLTVKGDKWTVTNLDGRTYVATAKFDSSKSPKWIDLTFDGARAKGGLFWGIYKLEGDTLTLCRTMSGVNPRPTKFESTASGGLLVVWKKVTPSSPGTPKKE